MNEIALIGRKIGMTREFYKTGQSIPVTVLKLEKARVIQVIEEAKRGYKAVQVGFGNIKSSKISKAMKGYFSKKNTEAKKKLKEFKREVRFLPAILDLENLIKEFKKYRTQIFLVVDEHGGTAGLITFYDFLKWFLGEMIEEWGEERIKEIAKGVYIVDAGIDIETLSEKIGLKLPEDYEYSTLGGYLISLVKEFPKQYTVIETPNFKFVILSLENNRIKSVKIVKKTS